MQSELPGSLGKSVRVADGPVKPGTEFLDRLGPEIRDNSRLPLQLVNLGRWWSRRDIPGPQYRGEFGQSGVDDWKDAIVLDIDHKDARLMFQQRLDPVSAIVEIDAGFRGKSAEERLLNRAGPGVVNPDLAFPNDLLPHVRGHPLLRPSSPYFKSDGAPIRNQAARRGNTLS